jgi:hypothetical protein
MRRRATNASFEPLQGDSAPRRALASMPPTRFGPVALAPAPDEQGHDGCELRAPPDTSLQAGIGRRRKGPALDRITTTFGFALASTRTNMTFPIPGRRRLPPQAKSRELRAIRPKAPTRAWKTAVSGSLEAQLRPPFPTPTRTLERVEGLTPPAQRKGVENGGLRYGATGARFARRFPHPPNAAPKSSYSGSASPALPLFPPPRTLEMFKNQLDKPNPIRARP